MTSTLARIDYEAWLAGSTESADVAVPLLAEAVRPQSVVDVGCGLGAWLAVFKSYGVEDVRGYDALQTGAAFLPWTITVAVLSQGITARLVARFGSLTATPVRALP